MSERIKTLDFWTSLLLVVCVFAAIFDPVGVVLPYVKYGSAFLFTLLSLVAGWRTRFAALRHYEAGKLILYVALFSVVLPVYATAVHFLRGDYVDGPWRLFAGTFIFFVLLVVGAAISGTPRRLEMAVVLALTALALLVWLMPMADLFYDRGVVNNFGFVHKIFSYQFREYGTLKLPYLYYYTSPMLVLAASYWGYRALQTKKKRSSEFVLASVSLAALFFSGTRADMLVAIVVTGFFLWQISRPAFAVVIPTMTFLAVQGRQALGQMVAVAPDTASYPTGDNGLPDTSVLTAQSNGRKIEYLHTYAHMFSDPLGFIFGYGTGSCVPRPAFDVCVPVTELTYLDTIRIFGILGGLLYAALFIYPLWRHRLRSHYLFAGWLGYLAIAGVNPYIFSTNGMTILAAVLLSAMRAPARKEPPWTFREARAELWPSAPAAVGDEANARQIGGDERQPRSG